MPTTYSDQFFLMDPSAPPTVGTALNFSNFNITDQNDDGDFDRFDNDSVDGSDISSSYPGDTVTINVPGVGNVTYTGITFYLADGRVVFTPNDGQALQDGTFVSSTFVNTQGPLLVTELGPACFVAGTQILTPDGDVRIENLQPGDLVETLDHGPQAVRWIGRSQVDGAEKFAPVVFEPGSIGNSQTLRVSPQHRMLMTGWQAELNFGGGEVLVPAVHLVDGVNVKREPVKEVTYYHVMFDRHEVIISQGVHSESFFAGDQILLQDQAVRAELLELFPELDDPKKLQSLKTARPTVKAFEAGLLVSAA